MENVKFQRLNECIARSKTDGKYKVKDFGTFYNRCKGKIAVSLVLNVFTVETGKRKRGFARLVTRYIFLLTLNLSMRSRSRAERCDKHAKMVKFFTRSVRLGWWRAARFGQTKER